ncbi:hypothetical protein [uncultured Brachyspira sp.]|uniref:hypothetical protein n=1 Tax=uncultured Brachyspira sp. TaxID=221953 RepID=UPI0026298CBA|nr:hypothetical protein [uncultured Brachyspira sp.]
MALYIKEQSIYLKDVKGKKTKNGKVFVTALGAFLSSYENEKKEKVNESGLNCIVTCYNDKAFDALRSVKDKPGFVTVSGKLQTNSWQDEKGEWHNQVELIVLSASIPDKKEKVEAPAATEEEVPF